MLGNNLIGTLVTQLRSRSFPVGVQGTQRGVRADFHAVIAVIPAHPDVALRAEH